MSQPPPNEHSTERRLWARHIVPIYYEDTDFSGFVYHAQYLKFFERAREQLFGIPWLKSLYGLGQHFAVHRANMDFLMPAHHGDILVIDTDVTWKPRYPTMAFDQIARRTTPEWLAASPIHDRTWKPPISVKGFISLVFLNEANKPSRLSPEVEERLLSLEASGKPIVSGDFSAGT